MSLPPELDFLEPYFVDSYQSLRSTDWLLSDFDENVWMYSFGFKNPKRIEWDVELSDGSRLIDKKTKSFWMA